MRRLAPISSGIKIDLASASPTMRRGRSTLAASGSQILGSSPSPSVSPAPSWISDLSPITPPRTPPATPPPQKSKGVHWANNADVAEFRIGNMPKHTGVSRYSTRIRNRVSRGSNVPRIGANNSRRNSLRMQKTRNTNSLNNLNKYFNVSQGGSKRRVTRRRKGGSK